MTERNYYEILGLTPDADGTAVNRTYWLLARKYQGEATGDLRAHHMLDELNEAYAVLGTPTFREAYDAAHPAAEEAKQRPLAQDDVRPGIRGTGVLRSGSSHEARRPAWNIRGFAPCAATLALGAAGFGAGVWSGSLVLTALGTCAALAGGLALTRHKIADMARHLATPAGKGGAESGGEPAVKRGRSANASLSTSTVRRRTVPADELRISTASMVGRWRSSARAAAGAQTIDAERGPDSTLVDIFRSEQEVESPSEPLSAVLEVLRGSRH